MGDLKSVKKLIQEGADLTPGRGEPLSVAIRSKNLAIVRELLKHKADPNQEGFSYENSGVLGTAIKQGNIDMVKLLLSFNADPNIGSEQLRMNSIPDTPLYLAVQQRNYPMVKILLQAGAKISVPYAFSMQAQSQDRNAFITRNLLNHVNPDKNPKLYELLVANGVQPIIH